jgi:FlaG/FlaF family flagellin (archaellin)
MLKRMKNGIKILLAAAVAGLATGFCAPMASKANNAQIKVTRAVHKDTGTQVATRSSTAGAKATNFKVAVMATPHTATTTSASPTSPRFIHR